MATVPYSPVSTVSPSSAATPSMNVPAVPEAFGVGIGKALVRFGQQMERSSDEIFTRAMALQEMENDAAAKEANVQLAIVDSRDTGEYLATKGRNAPDGLIPHQQKLLANREAIRATLPNDAARRKFDADSKNTFIHSIQGAARHSAAQQKDYFSKTSLAIIDQAKNDSAKSAWDNDLYEEGVNKIIKEMETSFGQTEGMSQEAIAVVAQKHISDLTFGRLQQIARIAPQTAMEMLPDLIKKNRLTQDDINKIQGIIDINQRSVGAHVIMKGIDPTLPLPEQERRASEAAKSQSKDPILERNAVEAVRQRQINADTSKRHQEAKDWQDINDGIPNAKNLEELLAIPGNQAIYERLKPTQRNSLPGTITRYHRAANVEANNEVYNHLIGLRDSDIPEQNVEFRNLDPTKYNISQAQIDKIRGFQKTAREQAGKAPATRKAMTLIRANRADELNSFGFGTITEANRDDYTRLTGALTAAIDHWTQTTGKGKPPSEKQILDEVWPNVAREQRGTWFQRWAPLSWGGLEQKPAMWRDYDQAKIPPGEADALRQRIFLDTGEMPTPTELQRAWFHGLLERKAREKANKAQ